MQIFAKLLTFCALTLSPAVWAIPIIEDFENYFGREFIQAEQVLSETAPMFSHPGRNLGSILPEYGLFEGLEEQYRPYSRKVFEMVVLLIPQSEIGGLSYGQVHSIVDQPGMEPQVRFFIHPRETQAYSNLIDRYPKDPTKWYATPSSSMRSLFVLNETLSVGMVAKTSLHQRVGRFSRIIPEERAIRAVAISAELERVQQATRGVIPNTTSTWDFFPESLSADPLGHEGAFIERHMPKKLRSKIVIPLYALISSASEGRWIDRLFRASGATSRLEFAWQRIAKPLVEMHATLAFGQGLTTELHQQNTLLVINKVDLKVEGLGIRDMDAHYVDYSLRNSRLNLDFGFSGSFSRDAELFRYGYSQENQWKSYAEKLRMESLDWVLRFFLNPIELSQLMYRADALLVERFNSQFPDFAVQTISELSGALNRLHASVTTENERMVYNELSARYGNPPAQELLINWFSSTSNRISINLNWQAHGICRRAFKSVGG